MGAVGTGELVRSYFLAVRVGYAYQVYRFMVTWLEEGPRSRKDYQKPSYESTRRMFYNLKRLGVIETVSRSSRDVIVREQAHRPTGSRLRSNRQYYRIVPGQQDSVVWRDSYEAATNPTYFDYARQVPRWLLSEEDLEAIRVFILSRRL